MMVEPVTVIRRRKPKTGGEPMSIASLKVVPEDMRTSIIRIHSYQDKNPQGTFYNRYYGEEIAFGNLTRLLLLMDVQNSSIT